MLNRETVVLLSQLSDHRLQYLIRELATDWLEMHDALREANVISFLNAANKVSAIDNDRAHHKRHDEYRDALERRINEGLREVAGLRARLAEIEQRTRGDEK